MSANLESSYFRLQLFGFAKCLANAATDSLGDGRRKRVANLKRVRDLPITLDKLL